MPPLTREQLRSRRAWRRHHERQRNRRVLVSAGLPAAIAGLAVLVLWLGTGGLANDDPAPDRPRATATRLPANAKPPDIPIARVGLVSLRLPIDRNRLTAIAFHPVDNPQVVGMDTDGPLEVNQAPRHGRPGPERGAVDVGAAAGTLVYAPVDGVISGVGRYKVQGKLKGYQLTINPIEANGYAVMMTHIDAGADDPVPPVGTQVTAGRTVLGQVLDFGGEQELSQFTSDSGNHVQIEVIRTPIP